MTLCTGFWRTRTERICDLHDVLEDTDVTPAELREHFGPHVTRLVEALTEDAAIVKYRDRKAVVEASGSPS